MPGDTVVLSATPIPGNEEMVNRIIDDLFRLGADVIYSDLCDVHVSGHGSREDLKLMLSLVRPKFFIPMHGEYRHLVLTLAPAREVGIPAENIVIVESGQVVEVLPDTITLGEEVRRWHVLVDGLSVGDIGAAVLRDRTHLARDGFLVAMVAIDRATGEVVADPEILTRGFVYVAESDDLIEGAKDRMWQVLRVPGRRRVVGPQQDQGRVEPVLLQSYRAPPTDPAAGARGLEILLRITRIPRDNRAPYAQSTEIRVIHSDPVSTQPAVRWSPARSPY